MGDRAFAPLVAKGCEQPVLCQGGCPSRSSGYGCAFQASCQGACSRVGLGPEIYSAFCSPSSAPCSAVRSAFVQLEACLHLPPSVLHVPAVALSPDQGLRMFRFRPFKLTPSHRRRHRYVGCPGSEYRLCRASRKLPVCFTALLSPVGQ